MEKNDYGTLTENDAIRHQLRARLVQLNSPYISTSRDVQLKQEADRLIDASTMWFGDRRAEGRALVLVGKSGAGKTRSLRRWVEAESCLTPERMEVGETMPIVFITAPSPCTLKQLAIELLRAMGYPIVGDMRENVAWNRLREQLRLRRVRLVIIDEMQHAVRMRDVHEAQKVSDTLKNIMQQAEWPVHLILSGLASLVDFASRDVQLKRRCRFLRFDPLAFPRDIKGLRYIIDDVARVSELQAVGLGADEFLARLCRAGQGELGRIVQLARNAAEDAIRTSAPSLTMAHFASAYGASTGCGPDDNIFIARDWEFIRPGSVSTKNDEMEEIRKPARGKSQ